MSIQNGVEEIFSQKIIFNFKNENNEQVTEDWFIFQDKNSDSISYDFRQNSLLIDTCLYKSVDELKQKIQKFLYSKVCNGCELIGIVDQMDSGILTLEDLEDVLLKLEISFEVRKVDNINHFIILMNEF